MSTLKQFQEGIFREPMGMQHSKLKLLGTTTTKTYWGLKIRVYDPETEMMTKKLYIDHKHEEICIDALNKRVENEILEELEEERLIRDSLLIEYVSDEDEPLNQMWVNRPRRIGSPVMRMRNRSRSRSFERNYL